MDKRTLVESDIKEGGELISLLEQANFPVIAALWHYTDEDGRYRLVFASPLVDTKGSRKAYSIIQNVLIKNKNQIHIPFTTTKVIGTDDPLYKGLRSFFKTRKKMVNISLYHTPLRDTFIDDGLLYRIN